MYSSVGMPAHCIRTPVCLASRPKRSSEAFAVLRMK